ncbi:CBS domain-containing protein [Piscirickettsia salmonis]|uniref:CBS domain-containing protein n=1 Tax=Piscirickettsia salmonis TaxID=1238 RepID=UPI0007C97619|nr:Hypoxic response protein 1 [Piscirickettsiaceae bacterium NZ-RLO1]
MTIVKDIMTSPVITGHMDSTIGEIYSFFKSKNIHHLPIVHDNHLAGLISDSDIVMALSPYWGTAAEQNRDTDTANRLAHQIMTRHPICTQANESIEIAAKRILQKDVSCLPVLDEDNSLCGILTWKDIIKHFIQDHLNDADNPLPLISFKDTDSE